MVFQKQLNEHGNYIDKNGNRYDILCCNRAERKEFVQVGTETQVIDGETVEVPVFENQLVINKGWDAFEDIDAAMAAYELTYEPYKDTKESEVVEDK